MKKLLPFLFVLNCFLTYSQTVQSTCSAPDSIVWKYRDDADKLAVTWAYHTNSTYKDTIAVYKPIRNRIWNALLAVYNATLLPARDTVVKTYNIHVYQDLVSKVTFRADSNLQWMKNIRSNTIPTGNSSIDYLMNKYYLKKDSYYNDLIDSKANAVLKADTNCNIDVLADTIRNIPGIDIASNEFPFGDGDNIEDSITTNFVWLVYSHGWSDCNNGCFYRRLWQFRVYNDCSVEYGGSWGAPLTVGLKENEKSDFIKLFPNPTNDIVTVNTNNYGEKQISLINLTGQQLLSIRKSEAQFSLDLSEYPSGIYLLQIFDRAGGTLMRKIIKE